MDDKPEGTPNPLNNSVNENDASNNNEATNGPVLDANPAEPIQDEPLKAHDTGGTHIEVQDTTNEPTRELPTYESVQESVVVDSSNEPPVVETMQETVKMDSTQGTPMTETAQETVDVSPMQGAPVVESVQEVVEVSSLDPTGRSMEAKIEPIPEAQPKKPRTGLIIGMILSFVVAICAIAAAIVLVLNSNKGDAVAAAMQKLMSGDAPKNLAVDGDINIVFNDSSSPIKRFNVDLDSQMVVGSKINTSSAVLNFTTQDDQDFSVKVEEIYAATDDLFFKIEGAKDALENSGFLNISNLTNEPQTNCINDASGTTNCETPLVEVDCAADADNADCVTMSNPSDESSALLSNTLLSIIESVDGVYLRLSADQMGMFTDNTIENNSTASCVASFVKQVDKNSNSVAGLYNKYPFIKSSRDKIIIASKNNPIYRVSIDSKNFTDFTNAINNPELAGTFYSCMGLEDVPTLTVEDVEKVVSKMPEIYVEVNNNNDFTRLYMETTTADQMSASVTIDLGFSYPTNVNVSEPVEYTDYTEFVQTLFQNMYSTNEQP